MKLLYSGSSFTNEPTFKRLLLIGKELCFMDRPSVTFVEGFGTIGHASPYRGISTAGEPVTISVFEPPSGPAGPLYQSYVEADLANPDFVRVVFDGIAKSDAFAEKFIQMEARYGGKITGADVRKAIVALGGARPPSSPKVDGRLLFKIDTVEGCQETLKTLVLEASIQVTSALIVADESGAVPVANDPYLARLIAMRSSQDRYVGGTAPLAPYLGMEFARSVIPDEALQHLSIKDVVEYRRKSRNAYEAWDNELNRVAAKLDDIDASKAEESIRKVIATELAPKVLEYRNEMASARDNLFGDIVKRIASVEVPALSLAYITGLGISGALGAFASATLRAIAPEVIQYIKTKRRVARGHAVSYIIGVSGKAGTGTGAQDNFT